MAYNTQEERLIVKGSERITRDLQVNHNIYVNQGINAKDVYVQNNLSANNLSVNTGNIENISTKNLSVVDLMLSGNISANGTNGNNDQVLGIVNGKPEWMNIPDQINEDNFVVNNISISNHAFLNGFNIIAMTVMSEDDYNNVKKKNKSLLYFTTPNGNLYLNQYGYSPNILPPPLYSVFVNAKLYRKGGIPFEIHSLSLSESSVTNNLSYADIYGVKENDKWNNSHSIGLDTARAVWKTNADYLYIYDASNMYSNSNNLIDTFIINHSLISSDSNYDPMQYCVNMCNTFANCRNFNKPVTIPENVTDVSNMFYNCYNFNQPVTIPNNVTYASSMFYGCNNFNQPVTIPENVKNASGMFYECRNFNQPVIIPNNVTNTAYMFTRCMSFNQPVTIPNSVTDVSIMFSSCFIFNQPVTIPENVTDVTSMFSGCRNFNQPVIIPNNVKYTAYMFDGCFNFNQPVTIPNNVTVVSKMFTNCRNFNQPVTIPNNVTNTVYTFAECYNFNQPVIIPNNVTNVFCMFVNCYSLNQPVTISENVTDAFGMFSGCRNFNQPVTIPNNVTNVSSMFANCWNSNQPVTIPENVTDVSWMFYNCYELNNSSVPIHISHNIILGDTSNYIYNALVNGYTGISFAPSRILNDA